MATKYVTMKGTQDGLVVYLDDQCSFGQLLESIEQFLADERLQEKAYVTVQLGYRYCSEEMIEAIDARFQRSAYVAVSQYDSYVMTKAQCDAQLQKMKTEQYIGVVRSGQVLHAEGDIVVVGDINPNGKVVANGNIFILGQLKGAAHAGLDGNTRAIIAASRMNPTHLAIADTFQLVNEDSPLLLHSEQMECAHLLRDGTIALSALKDLRLRRPEMMTRIGGFE